MRTREKPGVRQREPLRIMRLRLSRELPRADEKGKMKFHLGHYEITGTVKIPEFLLVTRMFFIDIDFTPWKQARQLSRWLPIGWCGAIGFPGGEPPWKYHLHTSWHAFHGEPDRIDIKFGDHSWHHEFGEM